MLQTASAEHSSEPEVVRVNVLSAFSTPQERELLYSFKQSLLSQHNMKVDDTLIFWERQNNWQQQLESNKPDLIIVIGNQSYRKIEELELSAPVLALMLNKSLFKSLKQNSRNNVYAITHAQPTVRFVQLAKSLNVYQAQIGSFISPKTKYNIQRFEELSKFYDLFYRPVMVDPKLKGRDTMKQLKNCCSVIVMESDCVFRPGKVRKSVLVNAYRQRIIVIAHSQSVLKEGAMLTLFTQPHDIGEQAAQLYHQILSGTLQEPYQFPTSFAVSINRKVARLLGYEELTVGGLMQKVEALEFIHKTMVNGNNQTP
ncbi:ABC transporter substrate binding protein [Kangiella shandongensis]|uniref:ABC transporter substrate binding protein n=1 Tax=Kangiella shandongensis TaxID=2763258 RepID=UPI001CBE6EF0|nr:ABC transporter substrate binding protein [Kangiella shandongensis]